MTLILLGIMEPRFTREYIKETNKIYKTEILILNFILKLFYYAIDN